MPKQGWKVINKKVGIVVGGRWGCHQHLQILHRGGLLHDIGKIGTPPAVLDKLGRLEPGEKKIMQEHVNIGVRILELVSCFREILPAVAARLRFFVAHHSDW